MTDTLRDTTTSPSWLIKSEPTGYGAQAERLARPFMDSGSTDEVLGQQASRILNATIEKPELCKEIVGLLGFDKLVSENHGQPYFEMPSDGKDIMTVLDRISIKKDEPNVTYPSPVEMLFNVVANGMDRKRAEAILNEVAKGRGENQTNLNYAYGRVKHVLAAFPSTPQWVKDRYLK